MNKGCNESLLFLWVTGATGIAFIFGMGPLLWSLRPLSWRHYLDSSDGTGPLLILFLGVPAGLALLGALGFVCGALAVSPFVCREDAEKALLASPFGGHLGKFEQWIVNRRAIRTSFRRPTLTRVGRWFEGSSVPDFI
jgi:hypothetical protein